MAYIQKNSPLDHRGKLPHIHTKGANHDYSFSQLGFETHKRPELKPYTKNPPSYGIDNPSSTLPKGKLPEGVVYNEKKKYKAKATKIQKTYEIGGKPTFTGQHTSTIAGHVSASKIAAIQTPSPPSSVLPKQNLIGRIKSKLGSKPEERHARKQKKHNNKMRKALIRNIKREHKNN